MIEGDEQWSKTGTVCPLLLTDYSVPLSNLQNTFVIPEHMIDH